MLIKKLKISYQRILLHVLYWIIFIFSYPIYYNLLAVNNFDFYPAQVKNIARGLIYITLASYFISYYLIPKFLTKERKYLVFFFYYILTFILLTNIDIIFTRYSVIQREYTQYIDTYLAMAFRFQSFLRTLLILHSEVFIFIALRFFIHYLEYYFERVKLSSRMVDTELNALKSQLHPHFLFNTLNNIYTLALECKNKVLPDSIAKMSDILRFTLYECNKEIIPLKQELEIINNYIALEKLRYSDINIKFDIPKNINNRYIVPLILFTFFENAFKHGASKSTKDKWINANIYIMDDFLYFNIKNSIPQNKQDSKQIKGIGLKNTTKRLDIFYTKKNYSLKVNSKEEYFEINLRLKLSGNNEKIINIK